MRFQGLAYRAHNPRWSFTPLSGEGAAVHGGRFNPRGTPALYLALDPMTAIKEAAQGFARKFEPLRALTALRAEARAGTFLLDSTMMERWPSF